MFNQFIPYLWILQIVRDSAEEAGKMFLLFYLSVGKKIDTKGTQREKNNNTFSPLSTFYKLLHFRIFVCVFKIRTYT